MNTLCIIGLIQNPPITTKCVSQIISYNTYMFKHALKYV